jgi:signal transduction histidine kinase
VLSAAALDTSSTPNPASATIRAAIAAANRDESTTCSAERAEAAQHEQAERARANERARIAREMHDVLAHRISLLSMHAGSLEFSPGASHEEVARAAGIIRTNAHAALEDLREVIGVLRSVPGEERFERPLPRSPTCRSSSTSRARPA